jgi:Lambda phage tail tube protein, TTP
MASNSPLTFIGGHVYILDSPPVEIGEITKGGFSGIKRNFTDTTTIQSPDNYDTSIPTTIASGEFSFEMNFIPGDASQAELVTLRDSGELANFKVELSDGSDWTFPAYVESADVVSLEIKKQVGLNTKLKLNGKATYTPAAVRFS